MLFKYESFGLKTVKCDRYGTKFCRTSAEISLRLNHFLLGQPSHEYCQATDTFW